MTQQGVRHGGGRDQNTHGLEILIGGKMKHINGTDLHIEQVKGIVKSNMHKKQFDVNEAIAERVRRVGLSGEYNAWDHALLTFFINRVSRNVLLVEDAVDLLAVNPRGDTPTNALKMTSLVPEYALPQMQPKWVFDSFDWRAIKANGM